MADALLPRVEVRPFGVDPSEIALTIAINESLSGDSSDLAGAVPVGLWTPAAWTAAAITFLVSRDGGSNFADLFDATLGEVTIPSALIPTGAARRFALDPRLFVGVKRVKVRSGVSGTAVNQAAARTLYLVTRPIA